MALRLLLLLCLIPSAPSFAAKTTAGNTPKIDLTLEQPAVVGMPVWLDVRVHDPCLTSAYDGQYSPWAVFGPNAAYPEMQQFGYPIPTIDPRDDRPPADIWAAAPAAFKPHSQTWSACVPGALKSALVLLRVPLHLREAFIRPGPYAVRWVIPATDDPARIIARSAWLNFDVAPSTREQRQAWVASMTAHVPTDPETLRLDYIPSLLAQPDDETVRHALLTMLCSDQEAVR